MQNTASLQAGGRTYRYVPVSAGLPEGRSAESFPVTELILLEYQLRSGSMEGGPGAEIKQTGSPTAAETSGRSMLFGALPELPFLPARILMQDFTGVPAVVDLAALRDAYAEAGRDPAGLQPQLPVALVIDHSVQVDYYAGPDALEKNTDREYQRNAERYELLQWASGSFDNFKVIPPARGICHQVNLEFLADVVGRRKLDSGEELLIPDTVLGTDSHTTMINGIGVLGWGVGGIEAEAGLMGQPVFVPVPEVLGIRLTGSPRPGVTATDIVLTLTEQLRERGVVGLFLEFTGPGMSFLSVPDRATLSNMCPEFGATAAVFPVDGRTLEYLAETGRSKEQIDLVEAYTRAQGLFRGPEAGEPQYNDVMEFDLSQVVPSLAGPKRPQDRVGLADLPVVYQEFFQTRAELSGSDSSRQHGGSGQGTERSSRPETGSAKAPSHEEDAGRQLDNGSVVIAAITSCTNTSNPRLMFAAALVAKRAVEAGVKPPDFVKTSFAPGSRAVTAYLERAGLLHYLEEIGFNVVGYGCTTCIGNSGPLPEHVSRRIREEGLEAASVLSGNRNFEGRIHAEVSANFLASPPLVVAYALAATVLRDLEHEPVAFASDGKAVMLADLWPSEEELDNCLSDYYRPEDMVAAYDAAYEAGPRWEALGREKEPEDKEAVQNSRKPLQFTWRDESTYIRKPPFFEDFDAPAVRSQVPGSGPVTAARVLALLGDSVTTDHISPAGAIPPEGDAGKWLLERGISRENFNTFGSRRGNHEVMIRGTFANIRLRNLLVPGVEGGYTLLFPEKQETTIFRASRSYLDRGEDLVVLAGKDYGMGSSRDWAAKGTALLGVSAVIAESFERIHRSNLVGMGVLPVSIDSDWSSLGVSGEETFSVPPVTEPRQRLMIRVTRPEGDSFEIEGTAMVNSVVELGYLASGGILQYSLAERLE
ncbi:MAG: aconitate hydratase AcnA [Spirochaetales bacterium]|nr:aconitate hydratase AcnA [Spirochaetales bacterium]MCF7937884.1 aconitate hydratase AcnA [Spirochaetales bacterium]